MKLKRQKICLSLLILILTLTFLIVTTNSEEPRDNSSQWATEEKQFEVRGSSLAPLVEPGQTIKLLYGYYNSQPVQREDIVAYNFAGNDAPIIKIVKAVPGDKWRLKKDENQDSYQIIVNDEPLKNSQGKYYQIFESKIKMLKLYVRDYPVMPENTYLILGNKISGSLDATSFGLIDKGDILGKVELCQ